MSTSYFADGPPLVFAQERWNEDGMPNGYGRNIDKNADKLTRPFETMYASGHFALSHGDLLQEGLQTARLGCLTRTASAHGVVHWECMWGVLEASACLGAAEPM